eukprot:TRINITY_DN112242_c0_g1_i1.p1 TRINITY_DN112242_c0_g1~~TRINITY_DN112242_c0_g1_i1.p1  ORF type:complete len:215 (+),score=41.06 TRINITY_DN112242_c0_g1_i1:123-767(+)
MPEHRHAPMTAMLSWCLLITSLISILVLEALQGQGGATRFLEKELDAALEAEMTMKGEEVSSNCVPTLRETVRPDFLEAAVPLDCGHVQKASSDDQGQMYLWLEVLAVLISVFSCVPLVSKCIRSEVAEAPRVRGGPPRLVPLSRSISDAVADIAESLSPPGSPTRSPARRHRFTTCSSEMLQNIGSEDEDDQKPQSDARRQKHSPERKATSAS